MSVFDKNMVSEAEVLKEFRPGSVGITRTGEEITRKGLVTERTPGGPQLSEKLRCAHCEIRPGAGVERPAFKRALKELEKETKE